MTETGSLGLPPPATNRSVVRVEHLRKAYGATVAADDISFSVQQGEILGVIGPNGAGKTTTVECISGLRAPDSGSIRVLGFDPRNDREEIRRRVGVQLQAGALPPRVRVREAMELFASFYPQPADVEELLRTLGLTENRHAYFRNLSGGQKQRLSIALALVGNPQIAILDELTTGLDPQARRETWQLIERVRDRGVTVILVTHYLDEAEHLCDRVVLIDRGRLVADDPPATLAASAGGGTHMRFVPSSPLPATALAGVAGIDRVAKEGHRWVLSGSSSMVVAVLRELETRGVEAHELEVRSGTLDDAFERLTQSNTTRPIREVPP